MYYYYGIKFFTMKQIDATSQTSDDSNSLLNLPVFRSTVDLLPFSVIFYDTKYIDFLRGLNNQVYKILNAFAIVHFLVLKI